MAQSKKAQSISRDDAAIRQAQNQKKKTRRTLSILGTVIAVILIVSMVLSMVRFGG